MKAKPNQRESKSNQPRRSQRAGPEPVLCSTRGRSDGVTFDIAKRKREDDELRRGAQLSSRVVKSLDCIVWEADATTFQFSFVSPQAERILGYPVHQWLAPGFWAKHVHPEDVERCTKFCVDATEHGRDHEFEYRMISADGRTVWLHDVVSVQMSPEGPKQLTGVMIDVTRRKVAEEALREREERLRALLNHQVVGMVITSLEQRWLEVNDTWCQMIGYSREELADLDWASLTHADDLPADLERFRALVSGVIDRYQMQKRFIRKDGTLLHTEISVGCVRWPNGSPKYIVALASDISERKRAEEGLRASEAELREAQRIGGMGSWYRDLKTDMTRASEECYRILGIDRGIDPIPEDEIARWLEPESRERLLAANESFIPTGEPSELEVEFCRPDGTKVWTFLHRERDLDESGNVVGVRGTLIDITPRKQAEELLRASEERFRTIFENAGLGAALVDLQGHPIKCNPALQKMLGFTEDELRNMVFTEFTHPDDVDLDWKLYGELVAGTRERYEIEKRYIKKDGQLMWGQLTVSPVKNKDGTRGDYVVGMVEDITERKRAQELLREGEEQLRRAHDQLTRELAERTRAEAEIVRLGERLINTQEEERTRIARELHDNLSQKVASIGIALSNIKREIPDDLCEARAQVERAYKRLVEVGEGIRNLSHQLHPAILEYAGLVAALESYCTEFEALAHVRTKIHADGRFGDLPTNVQLGIYRIIQEALQNIWKHSRASEGIIYLERHKERVRMRISDQGIGFDAAQPSKGRGLGLVSMRERARLLGSTLTVESSPGRGTTIIADVPVGSAALAEKDVG